MVTWVVRVMVAASTGVLLAAALGAPGIAQSVVVPVIELVDDGEAFAGETVTVEGELVGDYGFRGDGTMWTQLNDDSYARNALVDGGPRTGGNIGIGIQMPDDLAQGLDPAGGYRLEGPVVRVTGTWQWHDPDRGGETYLDVASLTVVETGRRLQEGPDWWAFSAGAIVLAISVAMAVHRRRRAT